MYKVFDPSRSGSGSVTLIEYYLDTNMQNNHALTILTVNLLFVRMERKDSLGSLSAGSLATESTNETRAAWLSEYSAQVHPKMLNLSFSYQ